jgi:hypothetical protein
MKSTIVIAIILLAAGIAHAQRKHDAKVERFQGVTLAIDSAATAQYQSAVVYRDSINRPVVESKWMAVGDVLLGDSHTPFENMGAITFKNLSSDDLDYIVKEIRFMEAKNKRSAK